jgi:peptidyl-prolyl cis-trans isomerase A (cyclophilin A)
MKSGTYKRTAKRKSAGLVLAGILVGISAVGASGQSQQPVQPVQPQAPPPKSSGTTGHGPTKKAAAGARLYDRALLRPALLKDKAPETYQVKFVTTRGDFVLTVHRDWAPLGADRFYTLVKHHFYDNASFFRTIPSFVVQFGISAYPQVSKPWITATIKDDPVTQTNKRGTITFATGGANTRTTQVFINLGDNSRLDKDGFAPFGEVTEGMDVVDAFYGGYGDGPPRGSGPDQDQIQKQGKPYLDLGWPKLDSIKTATLLTAAGAVTSKPAAPKKQP